MPNPYKKNSSNPYKKAEEVQKKAPGSRPIETLVQQPVVEPKIEEKQEVIAPVVEEKPVEPVRENVIIETKATDLLAGMIEQKPKAKSYGFYLDDEVVAALEKLAKQNKSNKSKVLNTLLRKMLIENK